MCWLHPGSALKLPCVLLSLFMIPVTLASLPCHFTNCCRGVYGPLPFPNVSDFFFFQEPAQKPSAFMVWPQKCVFLSRARPPCSLWVHVCACRSSVCVQGKAGQLHNCRENGGGDSESPTYSLWETCTLWFCPALFLGRGRQKRHTSPLLVTKFITCGKRTPRWGAALGITAEHSRCWAGSFAADCEIWSHNGK